MPPSEQNVCAIVITFRPNQDVLANLSKISQQVRRVVIIDNGSSPESIHLLRAACSDSRLLLIENNMNLGIASALNLAVKRARFEGFQWVVMFDQDSRVCDDFMGLMFQDYNNNPNRERVAIFCPRYVDRSSGEPMPPSLLQDGNLEVARTSGSLIPISIFDSFGPLVDELIIDQVDYEHSLRLRSQGHLIAECKGAVLTHSLGDPKILKVLGRRIFKTTNHSPQRRYYLVRNRIWLIKRFWRVYPNWCFQTLVATGKEMVKIMILEDKRWSKLKFTSSGLLDGVRGRMGMTVDL